MASIAPISGNTRRCVLSDASPTTLESLDCKVGDQLTSMKRSSALVLLVTVTTIVMIFAEIFVGYEDGDCCVCGDDCGGAGDACDADDNDLGHRASSRSNASVEEGASGKAAAPSATAKGSKKRPRATTHLSGATRSPLPPTRHHIALTHDNICTHTCLDSLSHPHTRTHTLI